MGEQAKGESRREAGGGGGGERPRVGLASVGVNYAYLMGAP